MGGSSSSIKDYQLGQPYYANPDATLKVTVSPATSIIDGQKYTVFQFAKENGQLSEVAEKYIDVLKTTRHPYILRYLALFSNSQYETIVTEHVIPLDVAVEKQEKEEIYAGLRNVLEAILFLHEKSSICHNGISVSSIYVSDDGEWKLASFENSSKVLRLSKKSFDNDIVGFKEFALSVLEYLKDDSETTCAFMKRLGEEIAVENKEACMLRSVLEDPFFKFPYLQALDGIQQLPLKTTEEKIELFRDLHDVLQSMSPYVVCHRFIPILLSHMVITDPVANELFMPHLFASGNDYCIGNKLQPLFDQEHFIKYSLPKILSLFEFRDVTVRLTIMKYLPLYVDCIDKDILQEEILPEILVGLKDTNDKVVQETFLALASIVSILGGNVVVGGESSTYFYDRKPDFSRSGEKTENEILATKVIDVLKAKKKPGRNNVDKMIEERKLKRLERAKQREEQRKLREKQKMEREATKKKREDKTVTSTGDDVESDGNESEAEWEGFEVQSNCSDQDDNGEPYQAELLSPVTGYNGNDIGNDVELAPLDNDNSRLIGGNENEPNNFEYDLPLEEKKDDILDFINMQIDTGNMSNSTKQSGNLQVDSEANTPKVNTATKVSKPKDEKSKKISLKKNTATNPLKLKTVPVEKKVETEEKKDPLKERNMLPKKSIDLGNEFDIKINKNKFTMEPDYFADMVPSIEKKTVYIEKDSGVSAKFNVDLSVEESSGWEDDGWGNDDDIF